VRNIFFNSDDTQNKNIIFYYKFKNNNISLIIPKNYYGSVKIPMQTETAKTVPNVKHDLEKHHFVIECDSGEQALLEYTINGKILDFHRTFSPTSQRGKGLASILAKAAFDYAEANGYTVIPTCSYISQTFLKQNANYQKLVVASHL